MFRLVWPLLLIALTGRAICGQNFTNRIVGGSSVDIKEVPYQANIVVDGSSVCSGAIIGQKSILTAAECVYGCPTSSVKVRVGTSSRESGGILASVCAINVHPKYTSSRYDNNLAHLELCDPLKFSDSIMSINVTDKQPAVNAQAEVSGWGSTSYWDSWWGLFGYGSQSDQLQRASVSVYSREQCAYDLSGWLGLWDYGVSDLTLCTYSYDKAGCTCDAGAPLVRDKKLVGILSYGGCAKYPDVHASLIRFKSWLKEVTAVAESTTMAATNATTPSGGSTTQNGTAPTGGSTTKIATTGIEGNTTATAGTSLGGSTTTTAGTPTGESTATKPSTSTEVSTTTKAPPQPPGPRTK